MKKIDNKPIKLIKLYNFINHNLIYNNKAINRYKKILLKFQKIELKVLKGLKIQFLILKIVN